MKHFINLKDIPAKDLRKIIVDAKKRKNLRKKLSTLEVDKRAPLRGKIRVAAEKEEKEFYSTRAPKEWLDVLAPLGTDAHKPFLETAPYLIAIFAQNYGVDKDGKKSKRSDKEIFSSTASDGFIEDDRSFSIISLGIRCLLLDVA